MSNHKTPVTELERKGLVAHGLGRCIGKPSQLADVFRQGVAWALLKQDKPDAREMTNMLRAMQAGEMTVSRGRELLDMWLAGNYSDDQLPPVSEVLPEDKMPWDVINELRKGKEFAPGVFYPERELVGRVLLNMKQQNLGRHRSPRWAVITRVFGVGSGVAKGICREFGYDPEEMI